MSPGVICSNIDRLFQIQIAQTYCFPTTLVVRRQDPVTRAAIAPAHKRPHWPETVAFCVPTTRGLTIDMLADGPRDKDAQPVVKHWLGGPSGGSEIAGMARGVQQQRAMARP
jgi:hypothetical protein